ncbi:MAG: FHA domain-containing protein [Planctomycetota bacterium]
MLLRVGAPPLILNPNRTLVVGRQADCDLSIPSGKVSRRHAEIYWKRGAPWIVDCGSQNGTTVNGRRITGDHELQSGDEITIGPYVVTYRFGEEQAASAPQSPEDLNALTQPMVSDAMAGNLGQMNLFELLQTLEFNRKTGTLTVFGPDGNGELVFREGTPVYAATDDNEGIEAVFELGRSGPRPVQLWPPGLGQRDEHADHRHEPAARGRAPARRAGAVDAPRRAGQG